VLSETQSIVDEASRLLGAAVTLEDVDFNLIAYGSQKGEVDEVRRSSILQRQSSPEVRQWYESFGIADSNDPVLIPVNREFAVRPRLCLPARWRGVTYGYLWVYDWPADQSPHSPLVHRAMDLAEHAAVYLARQSRLRDDGASIVANLLSPHIEDVERGVGALRDEGWLSPGQSLVAVVTGSSATGADNLSLNLWRLPRGVLSVSRGAVTTMLVPLGAAADLGSAQRTAREVLDLYIERGTSVRAELAAGIGAARADPRHYRDSWREARIAAQVAGSEAGLDVALWAEIGAYRLLAAEPARSLLVDAGIEALLANSELAHTARVFLDSAGNVATTAAELAIHRQSLYYRLGRVEALTGRSLKNGRHRLELHLALTLLPLSPVSS
jgi:hypothetical protein